MLADRTTPLYKAANFIGGLAAPIFLFLAGVSVAMAASSRARRSGDRAAASWSVQKRGWQIFGLAFLFRLQSWILSPGATVKGIFKADILNIMGPSIAAAAWVWGRLADRRARRVGLCHPRVRLRLRDAAHSERGLGGLAARPDRVVHQAVPEAERVHLLPVGGLRVRGRARRRVARHRDITGRGVARQPVAGCGGSRRSSWRATARATCHRIYPAGYSNFWTSSPTYYFIKIGIMLVLMGLIYVYVQRPFSAEPRNPAWSPMLEFGRSSLFVYWIHVELVYGIFSYPLHRKLPVWWSLVAFTAFTVFIYAVTRLKSRVVSGWKARRAAFQPA